MPEGPMNETMASDDPDWFLVHRESYAALRAQRDELLAALRPLAAIPFEQFDYRHRTDDYPLMSWNGVPLTIGHVKAARAAIAKCEGAK